MKRVVLLTGGGSAGHVTPHLALLPQLKALGVDVHYVGQAVSLSGQTRQTDSPSYVIEWTLIAPTGLPYHGIDAGKFRRYFDLQNLTDIFRIVHGFWQSLRLVRRLRPALLFSKGGFVTPPLVWATWLVRHLPPFLRGGWGGEIPIVIHESDMTPGLANRLCLPFADRICYSFPETAEHLPPDKAVYTGIPIRESLLEGDPVTGQRLCGFPAMDEALRQAQGRPVRQAQGKRPCVLVMGGSQGAAAINQAVRGALEELLATFNVCHIRGVGTGGSAASVEDLVQPENEGRYKAFSYVTDELAHLYAMADVVVARAGATTLFELLALLKPALLIPLSLGASRGDQIQNAASFARRGYSHVLAEADLTPATLVKHIERAYAEREAMVAAMTSRAMTSRTTQAAQPVNGAEAVMRVIREALGMMNGE